MGLEINPSIDVTDYLDEDDFVKYLEKRGWSCKKSKDKTKNALLADNNINEVFISFGLPFKDTDLENTIIEAFSRHGYALIEKITQL